MTRKSGSSIHRDADGGVPDALRLASLQPYASEAGPASYVVAVLALAVLLAGLGLSIADNPDRHHASVYTPVENLAFEDPVLRECVLRDAASNGWLVSGQVRSLRCNNPDGRRVTSLSGIGNLVNLADVDLAQNAITDTMPLERLLRLESLNLADNAIAAPELHGLRATLRTLNLDRNRLETLDFARDLPLLESLSVAYNRIEAVDALAGLQQLRYLDLEHNRVDDIAPLAQLSGLEVVMLEANPVRDVSPLAGLKHLLVSGGAAAVEPRQLAEKPQPAPDNRH